MKLKRIWLIVATGTILVWGAAANAVPLSNYYLFSDVPDDGFIVMNGNVIQQFPHATNDLAIAVVDTIRAMQWDGSGNGSEYDLNGNVLNANIYAPCCGAQLLDGTTDGTSFNYTATWTGGNVFQTDRNWANQTLLFNTGFAVTGITYDLTNGTLWIAEDNNGNIYNYDLSGNILGQFNIGSGRWGALAWEPLTDTLWTVNNNNSEIRQLDKNGNILYSAIIADFGNIWGGEFEMRAVPEPATIGLLGVGLLAFGIVRRRRSDAV